MSETMHMVVGGTMEDDAAAFVDAWDRAEEGEHVPTSRVLAFESWEALAAILTGERYRLLRHLRGHPEPSVSALARSLGRHLRRVQADFKALEVAGLVSRNAGQLHAAAAHLTATIHL